MTSPTMYTTQSHFGNTQDILLRVAIRSGMRIAGMKSDSRGECSYHGNIDCEAIGCPTYSLKEPPCSLMFVVDPAVGNCTAVMPLHSECTNA